MNIHALLITFMPTFDNDLINIYRAIPDRESIILIRKKSKRNHKRFKKVLTLISIYTPKGQILCRGPPIFINQPDHTQKPRRNMAPLSLADERGAFLIKNSQDLQMGKKYATITASC